MDQPAVSANNSLSLAQKITGLLESKPVILQFFRFVAIGLLNTALDFLIYNLFSTAWDIKSGWLLAAVNSFGFLVAVAQSFYWNRYWTFSQQSVSLLKNFFRLCLVGALGAGSILFAIGGEKLNLSVYAFSISLFVFLFLELLLWLGLGFHKISSVQSAASGGAFKFASFFLVTLVGFGINSLLVGVISSLTVITATGVGKNLSKAIATIASLAWNFVGYKVFVFKK